MLPEVAIYPWAGIADPEAAKSKVPSGPKKYLRCCRCAIALAISLWTFHNAAHRLQRVTAPRHVHTHWQSVSPSLLQTSSFFVSANSERLGIGGGGCAGHAIEIDRDLNVGLSLNSSTFANHSLVGGPAEFGCAVLEAWLLQEEDLEGS